MLGTHKVSIGGTRLGVFEGSAPNTGLRVTARVEADGTVTVTVNDVEIAKSREGSTSDSPPHPNLAPGQYPQITLNPGRHEIHSWSVRALDGMLALLAQPSAAPALTPSAPTAATLPDDPRVAQLDAGFNGRYQSDVEKPYQTALAALNQSYVANGIARARASAKQAGKLDDITALDAEETLVKSGQPLPDTDPETLPDTVKTLRATYRAAHVKLLTELAAKAAPLYDLYLGALDAYIAELTKANDIEKAKTVKAWRDAIAARKTSAAPAAPTAAVQTPPTPASAATVTPPALSPNPPPVKAGMRDLALTLATKEKP